MHARFTLGLETEYIRQPNWDEAGPDHLTRLKTKILCPHLVSNQGNPQCG